MYEIIYTNAEGAEVVFSAQPPFAVLKKTGFGSVENTITTETQYGLDGAILVSERLESRDLTIKGEVIADSPRDLSILRRNLIDQLNPKIAGTLTYKAFEKEYKIDVLIVKAPEMDEPVKNITDDFTCSFLALDPYWADMSFYNALIPLAVAKKSHSWPLQITSKYVFASLISGEIIPIQNDGAVAVGGTFYFMLTSEATNPEVYNIQTQEFFRFNGSYPAGTKFKLVTIRGEKEAIMTNPSGVESNAMSLRDSDSSFLQIAKGTNYFQVKASSGVANVIVQLDYQPLVGGV